MSSPRSSFIVILNTEEVPSQANWGIAAKNLIEKWDRPVLDMLGVNLSTAIDTVFLTLRNVEEGIAWTDGNNIDVTSFWMNLHPEDLGFIVHELVHVHQDYPHFEPGWITEGIADYIRWGFYEDKPLDWFPVDTTLDGYTRSYRITGGFFLWLKNIKSKGIVKILDKAMKSSEYSDSIFAEQTGLSLTQLWKEYLMSRKSDEKI